MDFWYFKNFIKRNFHIQIKSYLKKDQNQIIKSLDGDIEHFFDSIDEAIDVDIDIDPDYIYGAIIFLGDNNEVILDFKHFDLIDQLYVYFINAIEDLFQSKKVDFYFPDQPLLVEIEKNEQNFLLLTINNKKHEIKYDKFCHTILKSAKMFFEHMNSFLCSKVYKDEINKIEKLLNQSSIQ